MNLLALILQVDKKEFNEIIDSLKRIILMGRSANVHLLMALLKSRNISGTDGAIRVTGMKNYDQ